MHLIIDIGNTKIKYHLFENGILKNDGSVQSLDRINKEVGHSLGENSCVLCADVRGLTDVEQLRNYFPTQRIFNLKSLNYPFEMAYQTPSTLGEDRIGLVAAALKKYPKQNCLIIDAGSCLTYDLITEDKIYQGGAISPGIKMRFKALHHFTGKLPLIEEINQPELYGNSTRNAILAGVIQGVIFEIEGQITQYEKKFPALTVILTGGDRQHLSKRVKNTIFAEPNFLAEGLDYVLDYNLN